MNFSQVLLNISIVLSSTLQIYHSLSFCTVCALFCVHILVAWGLRWLLIIASTLLIVILGKHLSLGVYCLRLQCLYTVFKWEKCTITIHYVKKYNQLKCLFFRYPTKLCLCFLPGRLSASCASLTSCNTSQCNSDCSGSEGSLIAGVNINSVLSNLEEKSGKNLL